MPRLSQGFIPSASVYAILGMLTGIATRMKPDFILAPTYARLNPIGWASLTLIGRVPFEANLCRCQSRSPLSRAGR